MLDDAIRKVFFIYFDKSFTCLTYMKLIALIIIDFVIATSKKLWPSKGWHWHGIVCLFLNHKDSATIWGLCSGLNIL